MKRLLVLGALLLVALSPGIARAEPLDGVVTGQVVNMSSGGGTTAGAPITLLAFGRREQTAVGQQQTTVDAAGNYVFNQVDRDPNLVYLPVARYAAISYPAASPFQLQDEQVHRADINVFETTSDDQGLQLERLNLLVLGADQGMLQVMQMGALVNTSDRTFVTANPQDQVLARAVKFALPRGALGVQMQTGFSDQDMIQGVGGVQITSPLRPGRYEFALSFQVPYNGSAVDLSLQLPYTTGAFNVYVPSSTLQLEADNTLAPAGTSSMGGQSYSLYSAANVARSTMVGSRVSGLSSATLGLGPTQLAMISLGVVLFVLGGGVLLFGVRPRPAEQTASPRTIDLEQERLELVVRLAALDERFAAGQIAEADYLVERTRGKERLRQLLLAQRAATP